MAAEKKIRMTVSESEAVLMYEGLGALGGFVRDSAAIRDKRPSEVASQVASIGQLQDRLFNLIHDDKLNGDAPEASE
jgi:hypothetical protein